MRIPHRAEVARINVNLADLRRPDDLELGVAPGDDVAFGHAARAARRPRLRPRRRQQDVDPDPSRNCPLGAMGVAPVIKPSGSSRGGMAVAPRSARPSGIIVA